MVRSASVKQLCMVICLFCLWLKKVVSNFLGLINLDNETTETVAYTLVFFTWAGHQKVHWSRNRWLQCLGWQEEFSVHSFATENPKSSAVQVYVNKAAETLPCNLEHQSISHLHLWVSHSAFSLWVWKDLCPPQSRWNLFKACTDVRYTVADHPWVLFTNTHSISGMSWGFIFS